MNRISEQELDVAAHLAELRVKACMELGWKDNIALDLWDARQEIDRLNMLSQSQSEALDMMERGRL